MANSNALRGGAGASDILVGTTRLTADEAALLKLLVATCEENGARPVGSGHMLQHNKESHGAFISPDRIFPVLTALSEKSSLVTRHDSSAKGGRVLWQPSPEAIAHFSDKPTVVVPAPGHAPVALMPGLVPPAPVSAASHDVYASRSYDDLTALRRQMGLETAFGPGTECETLAFVLHGPGVNAPRSSLLANDRPSRLVADMLMACRPAHAGLILQSHKRALTIAVPIPVPPWESTARDRQNAWEEGLPLAIAFAQLVQPVSTSCLLLPGVERKPGTVPPSVIGQVFKSPAEMLRGMPGWLQDGRNSVHTAKARDAAPSF